MQTARIFINGRSQAVRLPKEFRFSGTDVYIKKIGISSITLSELEYGAMKSAMPEQNKIALAQFVAPIEISPYDDSAAQHYGNIHAHLERHGSPIGSLDMLIAAHALSLDSVLITNNESEFQRVPELKLDNWVK